MAAMAPTGRRLLYWYPTILTSLASLHSRDHSVSLFTPTLSLPLPSLDHIRVATRYAHFMRSFMPTQVLKIIPDRNTDGLRHMTELRPRYFCFRSRLLLPVRLEISLRRIVPAGRPLKL